jgi:hypothetical protein
LAEELVVGALKKWLMVVMALTGCQPLVQPPTCKQRGVVSVDLPAEVAPGATFSGHADGGTAPAYTLGIDQGRGALVSLPEVILATNVARSEFHAEELQFLFQPMNPESPLEVRFKALCDGNAVPALRAVLEPTDAGYAVTLSDVR